jgi:hypothetical protein
MNTPSTLTDIHTLRSQARKHIDAGAVTAGYSANRISHPTVSPAAVMPSTSLVAH